METQAFCDVPRSVAVPETFRPACHVELDQRARCYKVGERELERVSSVLSGSRSDFSSKFMRYHANIGTAAHRLIERFFTNVEQRLDDVTPDKTDTEFLQMVMNACANFQWWVRGLHAIVPIAVEVTYPNLSLGYAGTTDFIGWIQRRPGTNPYTVSIDWKTGSEIKRRDKLQQAGYSMARLRECPNARVDEVGIVRLDKKTLGVVDEWFVGEDSAEMKNLKSEFADKVQQGVQL